MVGYLFKSHAYFYLFYAFYMLSCHFRVLHTLVNHYKSRQGRISKPFLLFNHFHQKGSKARSLSLQLLLLQIIVKITIHNSENDLTKID